MLDRLASTHFVPLVEREHRLTLPDGTSLRVRFDAVHEHPRTQRPDAAEDTRIPFTVTFTALEPTAFVGGPCALELPGAGAVEHLWIERTAALGRDPNGAYFQIQFN